MSGGLLSWGVDLAFTDGERRALLALHGRYAIGAPAEKVAADFEDFLAREPDRFLAALQHNSGLLDRAFFLLHRKRFPGRAEALLAVARALGRPLPATEYEFPEDALEALLARARHLLGARVPVRGARRHKGRVGDGVERLLTGGKVRGRAADHPAAEIKSVPVRGDQVIERVKLGVLSPRSNPLEKCDRILFVFVEQRGDDHFVRGHSATEFDRARWQAMWRDGFLVETAAGSPRHPARGLYLTPKWFRAERMWPSG